MIKTSQAIADFHKLIPALQLAKVVQISEKLASYNILFKNIHEFLQQRNKSLGTEALETVYSILIQAINTLLEKKNTKEREKYEAKQKKLQQRENKEIKNIEELLQKI